MELKYFSHLPIVEGKFSRIAPDLQKIVEVAEMCMKEDFPQCELYYIRGINKDTDNPGRIYLIWSKYRDIETGNPFDCNGTEIKDIKKYHALANNSPKTL